MKDLDSIADLTPDAINANRGTKRGGDLLQRSLERLGAGRSIVVDKHGNVIAGNHVLEEAAQLGFDIQVIKSDGRRLIVVQREDLDLYADERARELAIADNRVGQINLDWDPSVLLNSGVELQTYFFEDELKAIREDNQFDGEIADVAGSTERKGSVATNECPKCSFKW